MLTNLMSSRGRRRSTIRIFLQVLLMVGVNQWLDFLRIQLLTNLIPGSNRVNKIRNSLSTSNLITLNLEQETKAISTQQ